MHTRIMILTLVIFLTAITCFCQVVIIQSTFGNGACFSQEGNFILYGTVGQTIMSMGSDAQFWVTGIKQRSEPELPKYFELQNNYPNPFNPTTTLSYALPTESKVTLKIYNALGQVVATPVNGIVTAGYQSAEWRASNVASGVYFYRVEATSLGDPSKTFTQVKKMVLMK